MIARSCCIIIFLSIQMAIGQKIVKKTILNTTDTAIDINTTNCYRVIINTSKTNEIVVEATMAGEYSNDLALNIFEEGNTLLIDTSLNANFELPDDKLGAHKVIAITLDIKIPENLNVNLHGTSSAINAHGTYDNLVVTLNDGKCVLKTSGKKTTVKTQSGTIELFVKSATIQATSNYGKVTSDKIPLGVFEYNLNTITGDIHIYKTN